MASISWCATISTTLDFTVGAPSFRSTTATNPLEHGADLAEVRQMLGHTNIATTRMYDQRDSRPEHSPVFKVRY